MTVSSFVKAAFVNGLFVVPLSFSALQSAEHEQLGVDRVLYSQCTLTNFGDDSYGKGRYKLLQSSNQAQVYFPDIHTFWVYQICVRAGGREYEAPWVCPEKVTTENEAKTWFQQNRKMICERTIVLFHDLRQSVPSELFNSVLAMNHILWKSLFACNEQHRHLATIVRESLEGEGLSVSADTARAVGEILNSWVIDCWGESRPFITQNVSLTHSSDNLLDLGSTSGS